jgi:hypothetical protein
MSPLRGPTVRYIITKEGTYKFLIFGSLGEIKLAKAKANQLAVYRSKLNTQVGLQKGGSLLFLVALEKKKEKKYYSM